MRKFGLVLLAAFAFASISPVFAQDKKEEKKEESKDKKAKKEKKEKKEEKKEEKKQEKIEDNKDEAKAPTKEQTKEQNKEQSLTQSEDVKPADNARAPASVNDVASPPPAPAAAAPMVAPKVNLVIEVPKIYETRPEMAKFVDQYAVVKAPPIAPVITDTQRNIAETQITKTETVRQTVKDTGSTKTTTNVKIIFNAQ